MRVPSAAAAPVALAFLLAAAPFARGQSNTVPTDIQLPGTQPGEASVESPNKCDNCHGGYDTAVEPAFNWRGGMMSHATRDPIFWASVAIAEQDFPGSGDLCIRCHTPDGWTGERSTPTDGSGLMNNDDTGVACDACHQLTNPDASEHLGVQNAPFLAHDGGNPTEGYYGSGMYVMWTGGEKLGPYLNPPANHGTLRSEYHRSSELCGTCHDVSNSAVGDLAPSHGAFQPLPAGSFSGTPGTPVAGKAAFNNPPYAYGIVERTFSEHMASAFPTKPVKEYGTLPVELQAGAIAEAWAAAVAADPNDLGDYADGTVRNFTCQTCHLPPVTGKGCNKNVPARSDLPLHSQVGGNYWMPDVLLHMDDQGQLLFGSLTTEERDALAVGKGRALHNLSVAAALEVDEDDDEVQVINLTGHKLISGYPEGRRMWLHVVWLDAVGAVLREDGAYGDLAVTHGGSPATVRTLLDPDDPDTRVYQVKPGISQAWAATLVAAPYNVPAGFVLTYDRVTGAPVDTLGDVAAMAPGSALETFHFVLNDAILSDTRIPPFGMRYDDAVTRNVLPMPPDQYGAPGTGETYEHYDEVYLNPPPGAVQASIELLYQSTSWEYLQFLDLANTGQSSFLANQAGDLLDAWFATGMSEPVVMASASWGAACGGVVSYCTAGTTASGCQALLSTAGLPSASAVSGFDVTLNAAEGNKDGIFFFGTNGRQANPWGNGTSLQCVVPPVVRTGLRSGTGTSGACDGGFSLDFNAWMSANPQKAPASGAVVDLQCWFRDPLNTSNQTTSLSDAIEFAVCP